MKIDSEHALQNAIRNELAGKCLTFRANVGTGWQGTKVDKLIDGRLLITNPRPFSTGLPPGFGDLFGVMPVTITPDMVGQTIGVFWAGDVKFGRGKLTDKQRAFLDAVRRNGGIAGELRSVDDALNLIGRTKGEL